MNTSFGRPTLRFIGFSGSWLQHSCLEPFRYLSDYSPYRPCERTFSYASEACHPLLGAHLRLWFGFLFPLKFRLRSGSGLVSAFCSLVSTESCGRADVCH